MRQPGRHGPLDLFTDVPCPPSSLSVIVASWRECSGIAPQRALTISRTIDCGLEMQGQQIAYTHLNKIAVSIARNECQTR